MSEHGQVAAVLLSDLEDHADANEPPCDACIKRARAVSDFFVIFKEMLRG